MTLDDTDETDGGFETIEHTDSADFDSAGIPEDMRGWYIILRDQDGEAYDEIGPFDTKEEAEGVQDMMSFDVAA
ncbi:hypothetical protein ADL19_14820 [Streptomyces purpurogeneiscleroticus]|nr:hypothetical protein ADL19_14820 [Streptomyces purpurogeneiscleroticus]